MKASILCRIGFHRWRDIGFAGLVMPVVVKRCARCLCGKADGVYYTQWWTAEELHEAIVEDMRRHGAVIARDNGEGK